MLYEVITQPKLIIVDEPTAGLDPGERNRFLNLLSDVGSDVIVILSTHIVDDVRELCTNMAIMDKGQIVLRSTPQEAIEELNGKVYQKLIDKNELAEYEENYKVISSKLISGRPLIHVLSDTPPDAAFEAVKPNLEDVFFSHLSSSYSLI